jgi:Fe-S cluster assembly protein SufD
MTVQALEKSWLTFDEPSSVRATFPAWLEEYRAEQRAAFMQYGIPAQKQERWKYTDLGILTTQPFTLQRGEVNVAQEVVESFRLADAVLLVFIDGCFMSSYSDLSQLPPEIIACSMHTALIDHEDLVKAYFNKNVAVQDYPFAALNTALFADGLFLFVPDQVTLTTPLQILSLATGEKALMTNVNHMLVVGKQADITLVHEYAGLCDNSYFTNAVTTITAQQGAKVNLVKLQHESSQAVHMENFFVRQAQDSDVQLMHITTGAHFSRDDTAVALQESGAICRTGGFYHTDHDGAYIDHHLTIDHVAPRTNSEMVYKGIADKKSRVVFNGRLHVAPDAQKINAHQENHNLLLSNLAEVYSKPELEIYADDVKCRHGATIGQIDQDALFYLRARGIDAATATSMLLKGFADDILQRISHPAIKQRALQQVTL